MKALLWFGPKDGDVHEIVSLDDVIKVPYRADAREPIQYAAYIHPVCAAECRPQQGEHAYTFESFYAS